MKERQRWTTEEDNILRAYVKQFGPREWHLVSQRTNTPLDRDSKSCLERWKNYLKPGIKKGSLTEEEQRLVIRLQAKHGNKWKKIAAEVPGRTAKRLGKWWEVYKEKQQRASQQASSKCLDPLEGGKYDRILENFAEKLVKERAPPPPPPAPAASFLMTSAPPWLATSPTSPYSPSVTLSLASAVVAPPAPQPSPVSAMPWMQAERGGPGGPAHNIDNGPLGLGRLPPCRGPAHEWTVVMAELVDCCRELEEGNRALASHKKEAAWRLKRVELQLESEKSSRRREIMDEYEAKIQALREEQKASMERIEAEYREQLAGLRRDADAKEQKMVEQWTAKHIRLTKLVEQIGCCRVRINEP